MITPKPLITVLVQYCKLVKFCKNGGLSRTNIVLKSTVNVPEKITQLIDSLCKVHAVEFEVPVRTCTVHTRTCKVLKLLAAENCNCNHGKKIFMRSSENRLLHGDIGSIDAGDLLTKTALVSRRSIDWGTMLCKQQSGKRIGVSINVKKRSHVGTRHQAPPMSLQ